MFRMCARNYHRYSHLISALGIVREPTVLGFMTSKYSCTHDIGRAINDTWHNNNSPGMEDPVVGKTVIVYS